MTNDKAKIVVITGTSQYGKSYLFHKLMQQFNRSVVYDPKCHPEDYPGIDQFNTLHELGEVMLSVQSGNLRARLMDEYVNSFDLFCDAALDWGQRFGPCAIGIDELAEVTSPGKAPANYGKLLRTGKGFGVSTFVMTQAVSESDKTCLRNSDVKICFHLSHLDDRLYMAKQLNVKPEQIEALPPYHCIVKENLNPAYKLETSTMTQSPLID